MIQGELELDRWYITRLQAHIEELFLIIKGKYVIIESMAHNKSCDGCEYDLKLSISTLCYRWVDCSREGMKKLRVDRYVAKEN